MKKNIVKEVLVGVKDYVSYIFHYKSVMGQLEDYEKEIEFTRYEKHQVEKKNNEKVDDLLKQIKEKDEKILNLNETNKRIREEIKTLKQERLNTEKLVEENKNLKKEKRELTKENKRQQADINIPLCIFFIMFFPPKELNTIIVIILSKW